MGFIFKQLNLGQIDLKYSFYVKKNKKLVKKIKHQKYDPYQIGN